MPEKRDRPCTGNPWEVLFPEQQQRHVEKAAAYTGNLIKEGKYKGLRPLNRREDHIQCRGRLEEGILFPFFLCFRSADLFTRERTEKVRSLRASQTGAGVPAGPGRISSVVTAGNIPEDAGREPGI